MAGDSSQVIVDTVRVGRNTTVGSDSSHNREKETVETVKMESGDGKKIQMLRTEDGIGIRENKNDMCMAIVNTINMVETVRMADVVESEREKRK